uniref:Transposase n=1 Tax=Globodera pallida TaxID=36090 RepID=A0A183CI38_GLOPA
MGRVPKVRVPNGPSIESPSAEWAEYRKSECRMGRVPKVRVPNGPEIPSAEYRKSSADGRYRKSKCRMV